MTVVRYSPNPRSEIEAAIKLLQANGYTVFSSSARQTLRYSARVDNYRFTQLSEEGAEFEQYLQRSMLDGLVRTSDFTALARYEFRPAAPEEANFPYSGMSEHILTLDTFPASRAEWRRA